MTKYSFLWVKEQRDLVLSLNRNIYQFCSGNLLHNWHLRGISFQNHPFWRMPC